MPPLRLIPAYLALLALAACTSDSPPASTASGGLDLPADGYEFVMLQRSTEEVPGSSGHLALSLDDITRGQVMLSIERDGTTSVGPRSVKRGDFVPFEFDGHEYHFEILELRNELIGNDHARLRVGRHARPTGMDEIEALIERVRTAEGILFVRNSGGHDGLEAADHLTMKWSAVKHRVRTPEMFIEEIATKSTITDKPYRIRFADGRERLAAEVFREWLGEMRARE